MHLGTSQVIQMNRKKIMRKSGRELGILYALIVFWIVSFATNVHFRNINTYLNILRESSFVGLAAIGMTFCIISGAFDLSIASMLALLAMITAVGVEFLGVFPTVLIVLTLGMVFGAFNGILVTKLKIPAFIATLAMLFIYRALAYIYSDGKYRQTMNVRFTNISNGSVLGIPIAFVIFVILVIVGTIILRRTPLGRNILAVGNSEKASLISGINVDLTKIIIFSLVGTFTAASAILITSRLWSANPGMKPGFEFEVIATVVLGGTSLAGGKGSVFNTFISAILFASINTAMNMFHVDSYMQRIIIGIILLFAFSMTSIREMTQTAVRMRRSRQQNDQPQEGNN